MRILTKEEFLLEKIQLIQEILDGIIFIYPTDTIYGIGCNATDEKAVGKLRELKGRPTNPFSVIAPSTEWIIQNCIISEKQKEYLELLPGPYTLILKTKNHPVAKSVNQGLNTLGIRIPDHWIRDVVKELGVPIITTSANKAGSEYMTSLEDLDESIKNNVGFIVYEGEKEARPSKIIELIDKVRVIKR